MSDKTTPSADYDWHFLQNLRQRNHTGAKGEELQQKKVLDVESFPLSTSTLGRGLV